MPSREVKIINKLGIHLRAAAGFVQLADSFSCQVWLHKDGRKSNGKSILSVLALGAPRGDKLTIETKGEGAEKALSALAGFVANKFGEPD